MKNNISIYNNRTRNITTTDRPAPNICVKHQILARDEKKNEIEKKI